MLPSLVPNAVTDKKNPGITIVIEPEPTDASTQGVTLRAKITVNMRADIERILASDIGLVRQLEQIEAMLDRQQQFISKSHVKMIAVLLRGKTGGSNFVWGHAFELQAP